MVKQIYDGIGEGYAVLRRPDPRISFAINQALGNAETVINVGAGSGSYEPQDGTIVAVEPSSTMIRQRMPGSAPVVQATATALPFDGATFDAGLALLTVHHWGDRRQGLQEMARVVRRRIVILTWDPASRGFWLVEDYFPEILEIDRPMMPSMSELQDALGDITVETVPIPHDCVDGFLGAYWRRPEMYLDDSVRRAISSFTKIPDVTPGLTRLRHDLADGTWRRRYGGLLNEDQLDLGYRLVTASS